MTNPQPTPTTQPSPALLTAFKRTQERNRELEAFIRWEDELFSNAHLSGNHKLEIRATRRAVERAQTHDEQGRARINLTTIAQQIGVSPDTMSRGLKVLKQCGVVADHDLKPEIQDNGERWTRHYVTLDEQLLAKPKDIKPPEPRNHGGKRYTCQQCGSDQVNMKRRVTVVCQCCQHESVIEESERNQEPETPNQAQAKNFDEQGGNLPDTIKPVSPPMLQVAKATAPAIQGKTRLTTAATRTTARQLPRFCLPSQARPMNTSRCPDAARRSITPLTGPCCFMTYSTICRGARHVERSVPTRTAAHAASAGMQTTQSAGNGSGRLPANLRELGTLQS